MSSKLSRREILKALGIGAGAAAVAATQISAKEPEAAPAVEQKPPARIYPVQVYGTAVAFSGTWVTGAW